jgi:hypothetical protein
VETFCPPKPFVENPNFEADRLSALAALEQVDIDEPIKQLILKFSALQYCFTLQSCNGHFQCAPADEPHKNNPIPDNHTGEVRYRIAYIALCIETSEQGLLFFKTLSSLTKIDPNYIQFGSADWFWNQWVNSYILQVEPSGQQFKDVAKLDVNEARHVEKVRAQFFKEIDLLLSS